MMHEALHDVTQEERRLREYISITRVALNATNEEASEAKATAVVTQAELTGKLDSTFFEIYPIWMGVVLSLSFFLLRCQGATSCHAS